MRCWRVACRQLSYETGRLDLPFVGHCTFHKAPPVAPQRWRETLETDRPDVAVLGAPFDGGTQYRPGARFGPRAIRSASTLYSFGHAAVYDHEDEYEYEYGHIVDLGDVDIVHTDTQTSHENVRKAVRELLAASPTTLPVILGGDHSVTAPAIEAFEEWCAVRGPIAVVQLDAHLDFVDVRHGVRYGHGNCMRRAAELPFVAGQAQLGIRNVSSTAREGFDAARRMGSVIRSVRQVRATGVEQTLDDALPQGVDQFYVTIDIDGFCPSIAPGTGTPSHGGFSYYEGTELMKALARRGKIVGLDVMEVAPDYDHSDITAMLAARIVLDVLGYRRRYSLHSVPLNP